jgi:hypothetical protein
MCVEFRTKEIPDEIAKPTGYIKARVLISDKTPRQGVYVKCEESGCKASARIYECRVHSVIDRDGNETCIHDINPEIAERLDTLNQKVQLCLGHILLSIAYSTHSED